MDRRLPAEREEWHKAVPSVDKDHPGLRLLDVLVMGEWLQNLLSIHLRKEEYWDSKKFEHYHLFKVDVMWDRFHLEGGFVRISPRAR